MIVQHVSTLTDQDQAVSSLINIDISHCYIDVIYIDRVLFSRSTEYHSTPYSGDPMPKDRLILTCNPVAANDNGTPERAPLDPRLVTLARLLARKAIEDRLEAANDN